MNKEFVPYELALELKQLGFDEPCFGYYEPNKEFKYLNWETFKDFPYLAKNSEWQDLYGAPTYSQAFRWFRENHNLYHMLNPFTRGEVIEGDLVESMCFGYAIQDEVIGETDFKTYEEAELECLKHLIFIVKAAQGFDRIL